jgi:hypothetical protein
MRERLSWLLIDSQTNNTRDGPFLHKYASPFWPQKLSKTVSIKGEGLLLAFHPSLFSNLTSLAYRQDHKLIFRRSE